MNAILLAVTGLSLLVAGFMSAIAWRMRREERRRSDARVAALSSAIYEDVADSSPTPVRLFEDAEPASSTRVAVSAFTGLCVVAVIGGLALVATRAVRGGAVAPVAAQAPPSADTPLELLELEHERTGDALTVRGIVRNPVTAAERDGLSAVVLLFDRGGALLSSGRATVPAAKLTPGAATPFVVTVPEAADVERFRLSFRTDTRIEPHVDRRTPADTGKDHAP